MKLTQTQQDALYEFHGKVPEYECQWKPKTMAKLAEMGLTKGVERFGRVTAWRITDAGREVLAELRRAKVAR